MFNKEEFINALNEDKLFKQCVKAALMEDNNNTTNQSYGIDNLIQNGKLPFERNKDKENEIIESAIRDMDLSVFHKLIKCVTLVNDEFDEIYSMLTDVPVNQLEDELTKQLQKCFDALDEYPIIECYTGGSKGQYTFKYMIDGRFYTEAYYYYDDETCKWIPDVTIRFSVMEYLNY